MKRLWWVAAAVLLAACGVQPTGVTTAGQAPTGISPGETLYFVDAQEQLQSQFRVTRRLGSIGDALALLMSGLPSDSSVHTEIMSVGTNRVEVTTTPGLIQLRVPLSIDEVTAMGIDQIVCTALSVYVQGGGSKTTKVQVAFTEPTPESAVERTCPLIS